MKPVLSLSLMVIALCCGMLVIAQSQEADKEEKKPAPAKEEKKKPVEARPEALTIGSVAPTLDVEHWVQDGKGTFKPVTTFEEDKVYVVEFWATWCGPCIASMPHIVELQEEYKDKGVQVVSISKEPLDVVEGFLDRKVRNSDDPEATYRMLTSSYCLTTDPDGSSSRDYMAAANQNGIPCAFVVGKTGRIEWIGHPMSMDDPLHQIVEGTWDRDLFRKDFEAEQEANQVLRMASMALRKGDGAQALEIVEEFLEQTESDTMRQRFQAIKLQLLMRDENLREEMVAFAKELLADETLPPQATNQIAWTIYGLAEKGDITDQDFLRAVLAAAQRAAENSERSPGSILDTVAHLHFVLGDVESAIKTQEKAVKIASPQERAPLAAFLKKLKDSENEDEEGDAEEAESEEE